MRNISHKEYNAEKQNFSVVQDNRGILYFANTGAILEFDGITWRQILIPDNPVVYVMLKDSVGRIYLGTSTGDIGYLSPDSTGLTKYISLSNEIHQDRRNYTQILGGVVTDRNEVVFAGPKALYVLKSGKFKIFDIEKPENSFITPFYVNNRLLIQERGRGLLELKNGKLRLLGNTDYFAQKWITGIFSDKYDKLMINVWRSKIYLYDNGRLDSLNKNSLLTEIYRYDKTSNGNHALGLYSKGFLLTDKNLNVKKHIKESTGLPAISLYSVYNDKDDNIWLGTSNGLSVIDFKNPFFRFDKDYGLEKTIKASLIYNNKLFVGGDEGLFFSDLNEIDQIPFTKIENELRTTTVTHIDSARDQLLIIDKKGIFTLQDNKIKYVLEEEGVKTFRKIKKDLIFVLAEKLIILEFDGDTWRKRNEIKGYKDKYRYVEQSEDGEFWMSESKKGVCKFKINNRLDSIIERKVFNTPDGLPDSLNNYVFKVENEIVFATDKGVYFFDSNKKRFLPHKEINKHIDNKRVTSIYSDSGNNLWLKTWELKKEESNISEWNLVCLKSIDGQRFKLEKNLFNKFKNNVHSFNQVDDNIYLIGNSIGFTLFNGNLKYKYNTAAPVLIREFEYIVNQDSSVILFNGNFTDENNNVISFQPENQFLKLDYKNNSVSFTFSALDFFNRDKLTFSCFLEGREYNWTRWSRSNNREYSNLKEGTYTFFVKSKNIYNVESDPVKYTFTILPPWYRTIWAYIAYGIFFIASIYLFLKLNTRRLQKQKEKLEREVQLRTEEISKQNIELEKRNELLNKQKIEISSQNQSLQLKNEEIEAQKDEIILQKDTVDKRNREILSSIVYAKRIQNAVLPADQIIESILPEHFILFKPRNIVSGDFYWMKQIGQYVTVVAADCTGHGVPGAFMSMLGSSFLNEIVTGDEIYKPGNILNMLRDKVKTSLHQKGKKGEQKDGMDVALYIFNTETYEVQFSGAYNPLYILRESDFSPEEEFGVDKAIKLFVPKFEKDYKQTKNKYLIELKPDRQPIAIYMKEKAFSNHNIQLKKGDVLYTFTDGYADQFGGESGHKLNTRNFKTLLMSINDLPMKEQKQVLDIYFEDWKGHRKQLDDVLVVGVRV